MDFDRWLREQRATGLDEAESREAHEAALEDAGTAWLGDGPWYYTCCKCGGTYELPCDTMEVEVGQALYCGGSPGCCP